MTVSLTREYRLYRFFGEGKVLLYIGKTGREPLERLLEHVKRRSEETMREVVRWERDPRVWASDADVLAAEEAAIKAERPLWNVIHNGANPYRIERPAHLRPQPVATRPNARAVRAPWSPRARRFAGWAGAWCVLSLVLWIVAANFTALRWQEAGAASAVGTALFLGWVKPKRRRRGRR